MVRRTARRHERGRERISASPPAGASRTDCTYESFRAGRVCPGYQDRQTRCATGAFDSIGCKFWKPVALCRRAICGGGWPSAIVTPARPDLVIVVLRLSCELSPHSLRRTPCSVLTDAGGCSNEAIGCVHFADWTYTARAFALACETAVQALGEEGAEPGASVGLQETVQAFRGTVCIVCVAGSMSLLRSRS